MGLYDLRGRSVRRATCFLPGKVSEEKYQGAGEPKVDRGETTTGVDRREYIQSPFRKRKFGVRERGRL